MEKIEISETLLTNLNIFKDGRLTLGGLLFFANNPQKYRPAFCVKAISFFGNSIGGTDYRSNKEIVGTIPEIFEETYEKYEDAPQKSLEAKPEQPTTRKGAPCQCGCGAKLIQSPETNEMICPLLIR